MRNFSSHLTYCLIACQEPRVEEEAFDEGQVSPEGYASLDGRDDEDDEEVPPPSPLVDEKSATRVNVSRLVIRQLKVGIDYTHQVLQAVVTPNLQPACFVVSRVLFSKLGNTNWRIVQSHAAGDSAHIYIKMRKKDVRRCHGKRYEWMGEKVTFCKVILLRPLIPDPMEAGPVIKIF